MKKIFYFTLFSMALMGLSSCSLKEDDNFDENAAQRAEERIKEVKDMLYTAPNGWLMEYYGNLNFGGYNVMVKFNGNEATIGSEKWGTNHVAGVDTEGNAITTTSHFKLEQSMGVIISFDGFNETFHYYSMPNNPDYRYDTADGLRGDFKFRVMSASPDSIILRGKKHNNRIRMTPIPADKTWASIINEAKETENFMTSRSYTLSGADRKDTVEISVTNNGNYRCLIFEYTDSTMLKQTVAAPYIVKADGYYFYTPVEVNGMQLDGIVKGDTDDHFIFRNNSNLQLDPVLYTLADNFRHYSWYMHYDDLGDYGRHNWDNMLAILETAGPNEDKVKIYTVTIGLTSDGKLAVSMTTSDGNPYNLFSIRRVSDDGTEMTLRRNNLASGTNADGKEYLNNRGWKACLSQFFGANDGGLAFKMECDNERNPSYIILRDTRNQNNVIKLYSAPSYFMNDAGYYND